ncbi:hypothetical protein GGU11DRAFT_862245 [Lentinula aff. detonsa]|nr:hypothetical protein GGU11DRAFT_862245 [Lentinula aff. detonsa]
MFLARSLTIQLLHAPRATNVDSVVATAIAWSPRMVNPHAHAHARRSMIDSSRRFLTAPAIARGAQNQVTSAPPSPVTLYEVEPSWFSLDSANARTIDGTFELDVSIEGISSDSSGHAMSATTLFILPTATIQGQVTTETVRAPDLVETMNWTIVEPAGGAPVIRISIYSRIYSSKLYSTMNFRDGDLLMDVYFDFPPSSFDQALSSDTIPNVLETGSNFPGQLSAFPRAPEQAFNKCFANINTPPFPLYPGGSSHASEFRRMYQPPLAQYLPDSVPDTDAPGLCISTHHPHQAWYGITYFFGVASASHH